MSYACRSLSRSIRPVAAYLLQIEGSTASTARPCSCVCRVRSRSLTTRSNSDHSSRSLGSVNWIFSKRLSGSAAAAEQWSLEECAEKGMALARAPPPLSGEAALEAVQWLLRAEPACRPDIWYALGNLHYFYEEEMDSAERAALGAEGAAKAVIQEIKAMRRKALEARKRKRGGGATKDLQGSGGVVISHTKSQLMGPRVTNQEAFQWYMAAAEAGHTGAMLQVADMAMQDPGESAANTPFAEHWYLRAAAGAPPLPDALFQLARVYHEGLGPAGEDPVRALELYQRAAAEGSSAALFLLGHAHSVGDAELGLPRDARAALAYLQRSADIDEHPEALYHLALLHGAGDAEAGVERDEGRYVELVARAAAAGSANALFAEGDLWRRGLAGRERSEEKALHWFELAAQQQHAEAAYCAAVMRYHGWGCDKDLRAAFELYQTAAEAGHVLAWREVASMHMLGEGVPRCEATARHIMQVMGKAIHKAEQEALAQNEGRSSS